MKKLLVIASTLSAAVLPTVVMAADYTAEIGTASTEGSGNVSAATVAVIGLALIGFGVGAVVAWMRK